MVRDESGPIGRWRKVGDPNAPVEMLGELPPGELRDAGVTVTAYECALPRLSPCPVCGQNRVRWIASMTLPAPARLSLPVGRGCTPDHAAAAAPTSWAGITELVRHDGEQLTDRFRRLPPVDPQRLREDIDATVDQRLPGVGPSEDDR